MSNRLGRKSSPSDQSEKLCSLESIVFLACGSGFPAAIKMELYHFNRG
jgi:hypothetical protein